MAPAPHGSPIIWRFAAATPASIRSIGVKAEIEHPQVRFYQGDCAEPERLFDPVLLQTEPHPWLVVEDAHHNVAAVLQHFHRFLAPGDYLVVEDSDVKRDAIRQFLGAASRQLSGGYAFHRLLRQERNLRRRFSIRQDENR